MSRAKNIQQKKHYIFSFFIHSRYCFCLFVYLFIYFMQTSDTQVLPKDKLRNIWNSNDHITVQNTKIYIENIFF
jgi:hypothetical protein